MRLPTRKIWPCTQEADESQPASLKERVSAPLSLHGLFILEVGMDDLRHVLRPVMVCKREYARQRPGFNWPLVLTFGLGLLFWVFVFTLVASAEEIDLNKIAAIESSGNPLAWNKKDDSRGLYQITPIALQDYNNYHSKKYSMNDLWNPAINKQIAVWMLNDRIPSMLRHYKKPVTTENIIVAYNAGISYVVKDKPLPTITKNYIRKYRGTK